MKRNCDSLKRFSGLIRDMMCDIYEREIRVVCGVTVVERWTAQWLGR